MSEKTKGQWRVAMCDGGIAHIVPIDDLREHTTNELCWCHPFDARGDGRILGHTSMDRREEYERGRMPS